MERLSCGSALAALGLTSSGPQRCLLLVCFWGTASESTSLWCLPCKKGWNLQLWPSASTLSCSPLLWVLVMLLKDSQLGSKEISRAGVCWWGLLPQASRGKPQRIGHLVRWTWKLWSPRVGGKVAVCPPTGCFQPPLWHLQNAWGWFPAPWCPLYHLRLASWSLCPLSATPLLRVVGLGVPW